MVDTDIAAKSGTDDQKRMAIICWSNDLDR